MSTIAKKKFRPSGQAQIVGAMIVFSIGVVVIIGSAFLFNSMKTDILTEFRLKAAHEILSYVAVKASALERTKANYAETTFQIPLRMGGDTYMIRFGPEGETIMFLMGSFSANVTSPVKISGIADSSSGQLMLIYKNNTITMRGVAD